MYTQLDARHERGITLIELIMFIIVVGAAVAGVLGAIGYATRASVDPMIQKQALGIAEAVMEEVRLMPFTYCDPDDPQAATALSASVGATGCSAGGVEAIGAESAAPYGPETRLDAATPFDNANDYDTFTLSGGITDVAGNSIPGLNGYSVSVGISGQTLGGIGTTESLLIAVTVSHPQMTPALVLHGYRVRYAPNALP